MNGKFGLQICASNVSFRNPSYIDLVLSCTILQPVRPMEGIDTVEARAKGDAPTQRTIWTVTPFRTTTYHKIKGRRLCCPHPTSTMPNLVRSFAVCTLLVLLDNLSLVAATLRGSLPELEPASVVEKSSSTALAAATTTTSTFTTTAHRALATATRVGNNGFPSDAFPLGLCEGDCDTDEECGDGLVCHQRNKGDPTPGCSSSSSTLASEVDFCVYPSKNSSNVTPIKRVGNDGAPSSAFPLGLCEGDCDTNDDCEGDLVCYQRSKYESVPGCSGGEFDSYNNDYCIDPNGGGSGITSTSFYLKRYWQYGYHWQGERFERRWCLDCYGSNCDEGDPLILVECSEDTPTKLEFVDYGSEFLIKIANDDLCLQLNQDHFFYLESCSPSNSLQRFVSQNGDRNGTGRFEISPSTKSGFCLTQRHEPRRGEAVRWETCELCRTLDTSYWNKIQ